MAIDTTTFAPMFDIEVEGQSIGEDIKGLVDSVEYESSDGIADLLRIKCTNPDGVISDAKLFQPGNEASVYAGYANQASLTHIGRAVLVRPMPDFPESGHSTFEVVGYSKDAKMMDNSPGAKIGSKKSTDRTYAAVDYRDVILMVAERYGFETDIDATPVVEKNVIQKIGMSDYDLVRGLANITGYVFWVDGDKNGVWTLHFKHPAALYSLQDKTYTFKYNDGDQSSLLSFRPELLVTGAHTKIAVIVKDKLTGKVIEVEVEEENDQSPDLAAAGDLTGKVQGKYTTASDIKLFFNDFSFDVVSNKRFTVEAEVTEWAKQWFRRMRENFILSQGKTIGCETLMARQTHNIEGIGSAYDGSYYFSKVKHVIDGSGGYICQFAGRRVVPE